MDLSKGSASPWGWTSERGGDVFVLGLYGLLHVLAFKERHQLWARQDLPVDYIDDCSDGCIATHLLEHVDLSPSTSPSIAMLVQDRDQFPDLDGSVLFGIGLGH